MVLESDLLQREQDPALAREKLVGCVRSSKQCSKSRRQKLEEGVKRKGRSSGRSKRRENAGGSASPSPSAANASEELHTKGGSKSVKSSKRGCSKAIREHEDHLLGSTREPESEQRRRSALAEEALSAAMTELDSDSLGAERDSYTLGAEKKARRRAGLSRHFSKKGKRKVPAYSEINDAIAYAEPPGQPVRCARENIQTKDGGQLVSGAEGSGAEEQGARRRPDNRDADGVDKPSKKKPSKKKRMKRSGCLGSHSRSDTVSRSRKSRVRTKATVRECPDVGTIDFCGDFSVPLEQANIEFMCLSEREIVAEQAVQISNVAEVLSVPSSTSGALLKHFKWNKDKLLAAYFDNPEETLASAGATFADHIPAAVAHDPLGDCTICGEELLNEASFSLEHCRHYFCLDCWGQYLTIKINEGQTTQLTCPHQLCGSLVPGDVVSRLVPHHVYVKFGQFFMQSFVDDAENTKWCPAPQCGRAVTAKMVNRQTVSCFCGHRFCFRCGEEAHLPASCEQLKEWRKKCQDESETKHWIVANTRECPKCQLPTEKNGGCNHMTCQQCKHEYCWACMKDWKGHSDYYSCNRLQKPLERTRASKKSGKRVRERQREEIRRALEKYLFYSARFFNYDNNEEFGRLDQLAAGKMKELQATEATGAEVLYIDQALAQLRKSREVLKYSYVRRYYLEDGDPEVHIFAYLQSSLEAAVEQLGNALQRPIEKKVDIINLTQVAKSRTSSMLGTVDAT